MLQIKSIIRQFCCFIAIVAVLPSCKSDSSMDGSAPIGDQVGVGGSMARFTIKGDKLYTVSESQLNVVDIFDPKQMSVEKSIDLPMGIETIFPYDTMLFIGSNTGMFIFDVRDPSSPRMLSVYEHITACDPVVVSGKYAYVTLRSGRTCRNTQNILEVIDVGNPTSPVKVGEYQMEHPHGLGVLGQSLLVCEGDFGLTEMDISNPENLKKIGFVNDIHGYDLIPLRNKNIAIVTGETGLRQYRITEDGRLGEMLSEIAIQKSDAEEEAI
ncbi:LVIVD repeat-containing protein [Aureibacter tunicatorum]|uniref:LVIVD repeat-containing protein n=1 Tax=Aureibacter tunicatorum TaxID=866807 RepID=A0AAE3XJY5_9BACT|nr:hypothetical protein [Aureibacter tunicatorum]MDR6237166.1 hypothetical protein [Aureibacter tunicatorum]BDD06158.1 hypothetical protein AUTU_36410 [Aureibacter tunicatorum]